MRKIQWLISLFTLCLCSELFAKACNSLKVSGSDQWHPIAYLEDNKPKGIAYDLSRLIADRMAIPIKIDANLSWAKAIKKLEEGKLDIIAGVYWTDDRVNHFFLSEAFTKDTLNLYVKKGQEFNFSKISDLIGKTTDILKGSSNGEDFDNFIRNHKGDTRFNYVDSFKQMFLRLYRGQIDYAILDPYTSKKIMKELNLEEEFTQLEQPLVTNPVHLMLSKKSACAKHIAQINNAITDAELDGTLKKLHNKYFK
jgi:polar amino acid transport system substrate-binding protein